jgi:hypothetical protein
MPKIMSCFVDLLEVLPLVEASRHHHLLGPAHRLPHQVVAEARLWVLAQELGGQAHVARRDRVALLAHRLELLEDLARDLGPLLVALDDQGLAWFLMRMPRVSSRKRRFSSWMPKRASAARSAHGHRLHAAVTFAPP